MTDAPRLDIHISLDEIRARYAADKRKDKLNCILYGDFGSGKTTCATTAAAPILFHSFDPGGPKSIRNLIGDRIIVDSQFEDESSKDPRCFDLWMREMQKLAKAKVFDGIGTLVIDSLTTMSEGIMNQILKKAGRPATVPQIQDYQILGNTLRDIFKDLSALPCHVVVIGHMEYEKDEATGRLFSSLLVTGKMKTKLPLLFDEVYVAICKDSQKGAEYSLLTANDGCYRARTRIGSGKFEKFEPQNFKKLFLKAGIELEDKL